MIEHKDRGTRFGFGSIETLLKTTGREMEVVNLAENDTEDLLSDLTSIISSCCARLYGQRRAKRKTEKIVQENLYNQANYQIRQVFIHKGKYLPYAEIFHRVKGMDCYKALPAKVANSILILLQKNWMAFFEALEAYKADPSRFTGRPRLPKDKDKGKGRTILISDIQALGKRHFKKTGKLLPSGLPIEIETCITEWRQLAQVRIVPRLDGSMIEVVYEQQEEQAEVDKKLLAALDLGVTVLAALTSIMWI